MNKYKNEQVQRDVMASVEQMVKQYHMLDQCRNLIIGLSGGADSVCLLLLMKEYIEKHRLDIRIHAIHVNHGIRGEQADEDQHFSEVLCNSLQVDFSCEQVDIPRLAKENKQTEEEAGRNVRYAVFERKAEELGDARIAVAHHMNDQAETVMMKLLRGSSLKGMCGIWPVRGRIIRPLLGLTRKDIEEFLSAREQPFVTDVTNEDTGYTRNRIRKEVIPYLEEHVNPQVVRAVSSMAESVQEAEAYIQTQVEEAYGACVRPVRQREDEPEDGLLIDEDTFLQLNPIIGKGVLHQAIRYMAGAEKDIYKTNIEDVYTLFGQQVNKRKSLPYKLSAKKCYDGVLIGHARDEDESEEDFQIDVTDLVDSLEPGISVRVPLEHMIYMEQEGMVFISNIILEMQESVDFSSNNDYTKVFDYAKMKDNLIFRFRKHGDRMMVTSDGQTRKLKKELIDRKIPKESRDNILLLAADSEVYWAVGVRRSEACLIDGATKSILRVTFE